MLPAVVETERLWLVPRTPDHVDVAATYAACNHDAEAIDEVTEYLLWSPHDHPKETRDFLQRGADSREEWERCGFAIVPKDGEDGAGELAGFCGLEFDWEKDTAVLGMWLSKPFWGRGYSGERAVALAQVAFERLDLDLLAVTHHVDNEKSGSAIARYVERMGGRREGRLRNEWVSDDEVADEVRYTVSAAEFSEADPERQVRTYEEADEAPVSQAPAPDLQRGDDGRDASATGDPDTDPADDVNVGGEGP